jgi:hypothetical protein
MDIGIRGMADALSSGDARDSSFRLQYSLEFIAVKQVVLFPAGAFGTLQAADEKHRYAHRDQNGEDARIRLKPMKQTIHLQ